MNRAGIETMLMNYYRNIDRTQIQFDFLTHRPEKGAYDDEINSLGGRVFYAPRLYPQNYIKYFRWSKEFYKSHPEYKIVHSHIDSLSYLPLLAAKIAGIPIRIAHSHNTSVPKDKKYILKILFKQLLPTVSNEFFACSFQAGRYLFKNKKFIVIKNAIDTEKFTYNPEIRKTKRESLELKNEMVLGHIGRFEDVKNQEFLIRLFSSLLEKYPNIILILIGDGPKKKHIETLCIKYKIENKVKILSNRDDVNELLQIFDVFLLPSKFEGLPVVAVEAQSSGLPCLLSNRITKEVQFTENCTFLSIDLGIAPWIKAIENLNIAERKRVESNPYEIKDNSKKLEDIYMRLWSC